MIKSTVSVLAAIVLLSPAALAEKAKSVTLTHTYDTTLVSSDDGAAQLLTDLTTAATRLCTSRAPVLGLDYTDQICVDSLVVAAVKQIELEQAATGADIAPALQRIALTQLASAN